LDRVHDRELIDRLEGIGFQPFSKEVWRVVRAGREPIRGSTAPGRWGAPGEFEVIYTAFDMAGALAEIGYRLGLEPIWPSKIAHEVHCVQVELSQVLNLTDFALLEELGVSEGRYESHDYEACQAISAAARFLGAQGIIVPNARHPSVNLVLYPDAPDVLSAVEAIKTTAIDWGLWRGQNRTRPSRNSKHN
jgi:RES domain-containing protein